MEGLIIIKNLSGKDKKIKKWGNKWLVNINQSSYGKSINASRWYILERRNGTTMNINNSIRKKAVSKCWESK